MRETPYANNELFNRICDMVTLPEGILDYANPDESPSPDMTGTYGVPCALGKTKGFIWISALYFSLEIVSSAWALLRRCRRTWMPCERWEGFWLTSYTWSVIL